MFTQNIAYQKLTLYSLDREFKKAQLALTLLLCHRVLEIKTLFCIDRLQNNRGLPCFPRRKCAEVETKEFHRESRSLYGYSRSVVYLTCNTNNTSDTVLRLFEGAVSEWGLPSRVRGDTEVENRDVAHYMLSHIARGPGRGSYITERNVHNSRTERLWCDIYQLALSSFYDLFLSLKECGQLDPDNKGHLFCLYFTYLPIIDESLSKFVLS